MSRSETARRVNPHDPDPITNRVLSDKCWDGNHFNTRRANRCSGWITTDKGQLTHCGCECHKDYPRPEKVARDKSLSMHIIDDSDCGVLEIK